MRTWDSFLRFRTASQLLEESNKSFFAAFIFCSEIASPVANNVQLPIWFFSQAFPLPLAGKKAAIRSPLFTIIAILRGAGRDASRELSGQRRTAVRNLRFLPIRRQLRALYLKQSISRERTTWELIVFRILRLIDVSKTERGKKNKAETERRLSNDLFKHFIQNSAFLRSFESC